jgi:hypothetical protein
VLPMIESLRAAGVTNLRGLESERSADRTWGAMARFERQKRNGAIGV